MPISMVMATWISLRFFIIKLSVERYRKEMRENVLFRDEFTRYWCGFGIPKVRNQK